MIIWSGLVKLSSMKGVRASKKDALTVLQQALISSDTGSLASLQKCAAATARESSLGGTDFTFPERGQTCRVGRDLCLLHPWS